jgi:hypothetical protein
VYWIGVRYNLRAIILTWDNTLTALMHNKSQSNQIIFSAYQTTAFMRDKFKRVTITPHTTSTYASGNVEMETLLRAEVLWKCSQVSLKSQPARRLLQVASLPRMSERHSKLVGRATILYWDLFSDPCLSTLLSWKNAHWTHMVRSRQFKVSGEDSKASIWNFLRRSSSQWFLDVSLQFSVP